MFVLYNIYITSRIKILEFLGFKPAHRLWFGVVGGGGAHRVNSNPRARLPDIPSRLMWFSVVNVGDL